MAVNWEQVLASVGVSLNAIDIGCSGYRPYQWDLFGSQINYFGVDPLEREIEKLSALNKINSNYLAGFVRVPGGSMSADVQTQRFFNRSSAYKDMNSGYDLVKENFNSGQSVVWSNKYYTISEIIEISGFNQLDLLKIDVDGDDYPCLLEFSKNPIAKSLLCLDIESQFHGDAGEYGNNFSNISTKCTDLGMHLYNLDTYKYSRSCLPSKYVFDFPAQTHTGQVLWGGAVFMKDGTSEPYSFEQVLKTSAIYYIYDLHDCAFELLSQYKTILIEELDINAILNQIIRDNENSNFEKQHKKNTSISKSLIRRLLWK